MNTTTQQKQDPTAAQTPEPPEPVNNPMTIMDQGALLIVKIEKCILVPIVRTSKEEQARGLETIETVVERAQKLADFDVCINGVWYDYSYWSASQGIAPLEDTINEGEVLLATGERHGAPSKEGYFAAQKNDLTWQFGYGNLPSSGFRTGMGGLCPLIINGLKYGAKNEYKAGVPSGAPLIGEPDQKFKQFLIQRSSNKFTALQKTSPRVGKSGFGVTKDGTGIIMVQPHGISKGITTEQFRDTFIGLGCIHAMACDGSDSVFMYRKKTNNNVVFECRPGEWKRNSMTIALGFKSYNAQKYKNYIENLRQYLLQLDELKKADSKK